MAVPRGSVNEKKDGNDAALDDVNDIGARLVVTLRPTFFAFFLSGNLLLQARPILTMQCAGGGAATATAARARLANAASLGSLGDLLLSPLIGKLSDQHGRKPFLIFHLVAPALAWSAVLASGHSDAMRARLLLVDLFTTRGFGMMAAANMANVAISDVITPADQPRARAALHALRACGVVVGSLLGGWIQSKYGLAAPYAFGVIATSLGVLNLVSRMPETLQAKTGKDKSNLVETVAEKKASSRGGGLRGSLGVLSRVLSDAELRALSVSLALQEISILPQFSDVAALMFREVLQWSPTATGRFIASYGVASFLGTQATGALVDRLGPELQTSLSHAGLAIAFACWGAARSSFAMVLTLIPLTMSFGRSFVLQSRAVARAVELGLGKGEAVAAMQTLGAFARILSPRLLMALYSASSTKSANGAPQLLALPRGAPMFFISAIGCLCEVLHQASLRARRSREGNTLKNAKLHST